MYLYCCWFFVNLYIFSLYSSLNSKVSQTRIKMLNLRCRSASRANTGIIFVVILFVGIYIVILGATK